jgi:hypothetical protein
MKVIEIYPHLKENSTIKIYDYQVYISNGGHITNIDKILLRGRTCELRTINEDYKLDLKDKDLGKFGFLSKLED